MAVEYSIIMTTIGLEKQAAWEIGEDTITLSQMAVGDSNGTSYSPDADQTSLVNQTWIGNITRVYQHKTLLNRIVVEATIPANVGGWDIREVGIYDSDGDLIFIGSYPLTIKPAPGSGSEKEVTILIVKELDNTGAITLIVDSAAFATLNDLQQIDWKASVRVATTGNVVLSGLQTIDGVSLLSNDTVLVRNQTDGSENGIYYVQSGSWIRREDANTDDKVTAGLVVVVEEGTLNADTIWMLTNNNQIVLDTTDLVFVKIYPGPVGKSKLYFFGQI